MGRTRSGLRRCGRSRRALARGEYRKSSVERRPAQFTWRSLPLPVGRAQLELLELAGRGAGELVAELDRRRALVAGQPRCGSARSARPRSPSLPGREHDQRLDRLAPLLVGHADHRRLGHRRVAGTGRPRPRSSDTFSPPVMITSFLRSEIVEVAVVVDARRRRRCGTSRPASASAVSSGLFPVAARTRRSTRASTSPSSPTRSRTPIAGAPARPSLAARPAGSSRPTRRGGG